MKLSNVFALTLHAYAHYGATGATQALTSSGSLAATPSATGMPREGKAPVASFVRMDGTLAQVINGNSHEGVAVTMENDVPAWSAGPPEEVTIMTTAFETIDSVSVHGKQVAALREAVAAGEAGEVPSPAPPPLTVTATPVGSAGQRPPVPDAYKDVWSLTVTPVGSAGSGPENTNEFLPQWSVTATPVGSPERETPVHDETLTTAATPVGSAGSGPANPEEFLPQSTVTATPVGSPGQGPPSVGVESNVPTTSVTLTATPVGSSGGGNPPLSCALGAVWTSGTCSSPSIGMSSTTDNSAPSVPTTMSTVTVNNAEPTQPPNDNEAPISDENLPSHITMEDMQPGYPPAFIATLVFTLLWGAFSVWAIRSVWKDDEKEEEEEERMKHQQWMGQEASDSQRDPDRSKSSGPANS